MADFKLAVEAKSMSKARVDVKARNFSYIIDEPPRLGGTDLGPTALEYLLGSLAGCVNFIGHLVAKEMGFNIESLSMRIEGKIDPMGYSGKDDNIRPGLKEIAVHLDIKSDASPETLEKWTKMVEKRCPVSDNIRNETPIKMILSNH